MTLEDVIKKTILPMFFMISGFLFFLGFVIFFSSLLISIVCYLTVKEKKSN